MKEYRYYAFVSYRGADVKWAKWFVKKSDNYLLPTITPEDTKAGNRAPSKLKEDDKYLYPVFRDRDNLKSGKILDQILAAIDVSRKIVVICTPTAAKSGSWMDDELRHIIEANRISQIIPLVVEGRIYSIEEYEAVGRSIDDPFPDDCNPYVLRCYMKEHREHAEAINYIEIEEQGIRNPERAFIKCVASIIDMPFDNLWDRFGKEQKRKSRLRRLYVAIAVIAACLVGIATWFYTLPVDVTIGLNETSVHNDKLPPLENAEITMTVDNVTVKDTIASIDDFALFEKRPHSDIGKEAHILFRCQNWLTTDTNIVLSKMTTINICRDPHPYGDIQFRLWNINEAKTYPNTKVSINDHDMMSDKEGRVTYSMPLAEQGIFYIIKSSKVLENDTLYMPITESTIIEVK